MTTWSPALSVRLWKVTTDRRLGQDDGVRGGGGPALVDPHRALRRHDDRGCVVVGDAGRDAADDGIRVGDVGRGRGVRDQAVVTLEVARADDDRAAVEVA